MANIKSFPNNQNEYIGAEHVMRWLHGRSSGVFGADGNAAVAPVLDAMAVTVSDGNGWISNDNADGVVWWIDNESVNNEKLRLAVDMADSVLPRIDRVVVSWQTTNYVALPEVSILKGVPATYPVPPTLTNNNILRQISLAAIRIPAGVTAITGSMITDERLDSSVCGLVTCGISVDTSVMQAQWAASYDEFMQYLGAQQAAWDSFFQNVQHELVIPVPNVNAIGKSVVVNDTGDAYSLGTSRLLYATIRADKWNGAEAPYTQVIALDWIIASDTPHIAPVYSGDIETKLEQMDAMGCISEGETGNGTITFTCFEDKPEIDIEVQIEVLR